MSDEPISAGCRFCLSAPVTCVQARRGRLFVLSGPSGVGKGSLLKALLECEPGIVRSISATTRSPRPGEVDGVDYHFLRASSSSTDITAGRFIEYAEYNRNYYGTPLEPVERLRESGSDVVLEIEVQGAQIVSTLIPDVVLIFVQPPSMEALEQPPAETRLRLRAADCRAPPDRGRRSCPVCRSTTMRSSTTTSNRPWTN